MLEALREVGQEETPQQVDSRMALADPELLCFLRQRTNLQRRRRLASALERLRHGTLVVVVEASLVVGGHMGRGSQNPVEAESPADGKLTNASRKGDAADANPDKAAVLSQGADAEAAAGKSNAGKTPVKRGWARPSREEIVRVAELHAQPLLGGLGNQETQEEPEGKRGDVQDEDGGVKGGETRAYEQLHDELLQDSPIRMWVNQAPRVFRVYRKESYPLALEPFTSSRRQAVAQLW